ncbi:S-layer homology domain-containing protein [Paenibacillus sabuli]|nr:S-layer homology domain-containing protein [Paenibacillus sabuli]
MNMRGLRAMPIGILLCAALICVGLLVGGSRASATGADLENGEYTIDYLIMKKERDEQSVMQDYVLTPATLTVTDEGMRVAFTLKQSAEITGLQFEGEDVALESEDKAANTRVISFPVDDLSEVLDGWVKIEWAAFNYFNEYDIRIRLDSASLSPINESSEPSEEQEPADPAPQEETDASEIRFSDTDGHWADEAIRSGVERGIAAGYADGTFRPDGEITRGEFAVMLSRALELPELAASPAFDDADDIAAWALPHIASAQAAGLMGGYTDHTFRASRSISRAELAVIVARAAELDTAADAELGYVDAASIPVWALPSIAAVADAGLLKGKSGNRFDAAALATRAEVLALMLRLQL